MDIKEFAERATEIKKDLKTEEATKTALILPFFQMLGYDIFNPNEFIPEFTCDVGTKKGEKVDYAIKINDKLVIIVEAKSINNDLSKVDSQLIRYFNISEARLGLMTNGIQYKFYGDLEKENMMDKKPFFEFDLENLTPQNLLDIENFKRENFDIDKTLSLATDMRTINELKSNLRSELAKPSVDFTKVLINGLHDGVKNKNVIDYYKPFIIKAFNQVINEMVETRLNNALTGIKEDKNIIEAKENKIITTEEELVSFQIIKSILINDVDVDRIYHRDTESYFGILLDDNKNKWICRISIKTDWIDVMYNNGEKDRINKINDLFSLKEKLITCLYKVIKQ